MITFNEAHKLIRSARSTSAGKPIYSLPNTRVMLTQGTLDSPEILSIRYHNTNIVNILPNDTYILKTANWNTRTTKRRINTLTPATVIQRKGIWYCGSERYYDGIMVDSDGSIIEDNAVC